MTRKRRETVFAIGGDKDTALRSREGTKQSFPKSTLCPSTDNVVADPTVIAPTFAR